MESMSLEKMNERRNVAYLITSIVLALFYSGAMIIATMPILTHIFSSQHNFFTTNDDQVYFLVLVRIMVVAWSFIVTLFQGAIFGCVFAVVARKRCPAVVESWCYVLLGQVPFTVLTFTLYGIFGVESLVFMQQEWFHYALGLFGVVVYSVCLTTRNAVYRYLSKQKIFMAATLLIVLNVAVLLLTSHVNF